MNTYMLSPGKIMMTVFANDGSTKGIEAQQQLWDRELSGYKRTNVQFVRLEVCTLQTVAENVYEKS